MQINLRRCIICGREFHQIDNIPRIPSPCGHTFCSQCLEAILIGSRLCPFDLINNSLNFQADQFPVNTTILARFSTCTSHNKPEDLFCLNEYKKICADCQGECLEKRHKIRILKDIEERADKKKKILWSITEEFDAEYREIIPLINEKEEVLLKEVDKNFAFFQVEMEKTKSHIHSAVKRYFEEQRKIADESYNHDVQLISQANDLFQILNKKLFDQSFFNAIRAHIGSLAISSQKPQISATISVLNNHIEAIRVELMTLLSRIPTLIENRDNINNCKVEEDHMEEEPLPRIETKEDYLQAVSLFHAEIEENNRLILSFKNHQIETENILSDLERLKTINKLTLNINKSPLWKEAIENLKYIWNKFDKVLDFKIDFSFKTHAKDTLEALVHQSDIWATSDLLEFSIDLSASQVQDEQAMQLFEKAISKMINVEKLEIILQNTKITDKSIKALASITLPNLTDFRFDINSTKISDDAMEKLLTGLQDRKRNFKGLAFGFNSTTITDKTIENIAKNLSALSVGLRKFDLSLSNTKISDESLSTLFEAFDSKFSKLKEFTLNTSSSKVSNEGLKFFVQRTLPKMISLENFELILNNQKQITDQIITEIAERLYWMKNLKKICLEFGGTEVSGKAMASLEQFALNTLSGFHPIFGMFTHSQFW